MSQRLRWVLDIDIVKYFDSISHSHLRDFLDQRVTDGVIRRMIDKWLKAGVLEDGLLRHATEGAPQGGVISPCLSNIFLHHVLDEWFELEVQPRLKGRCTLVRFADDAVMAFEDSLDAKRVLGVLGKRLAAGALARLPCGSARDANARLMVDLKLHLNSRGNLARFWNLWDRDFPGIWTEKTEICLWAALTASGGRIRTGLA